MGTHHPLSARCFACTVSFCLCSLCEGLGTVSSALQTRLLTESTHLGPRGVPVSPT